MCDTQGNIFDEDSYEDEEVEEEVEEAKEEKVLTLNDKFISIQGEGPAAGFPALFLRLQGCNMDCPFCDTPDAKVFGTDAAIVMTFEEFEGQLIRQGTPSDVVFTGGEPLLQSSAISEFLWRLSPEVFAKTTFFFETNGTTVPKGIGYSILKRADSLGLSPNVHFTISPKPWVKGEAFDALALLMAYSFLSNKFSFKFVVQSMDEVYILLEEVQAAIYALELDEDYTLIVSFMGLDNTIDFMKRLAERKVIEDLIKMAPNISMQFMPRLQTILQIP